jgi:hypothetical protein
VREYCQQIVKWCAAVFCAAAVLGLSAGAGVCGTKVSVQADNEPLITVLENIARQAGILIFVAKDMPDVRVTVHVTDMEVEKALDRVLKGMNVAKIFHDQSGSPVLTGIRIFPKGGYSGLPDVVVQAGISGSDPPFAGFGDPVKGSRQQLLYPQEYVRTAGYDSLVPAAAAFEKKEADAWDDIQALGEQADREFDETRQQIFNLSLLDMYESFEKMQQNHVNTLEKMRRTEHFMESRAAALQTGIQQGGINENNI